MIPDKNIDISFFYGTIKMRPAAEPRAAIGGIAGVRFRFFLPIILVPRARRLRFRPPVSRYGFPDGRGQIGKGLKEVINNPYAPAPPRGESPPEIEVRYFGSIRAAAGKGGEKAALAPGMTLLALLQKLSVINGGDFHGEIFEGAGESLREDLMVTLNQAIVARADAAGAGLNPGDVVALFPLFPGGG